MQHLAVPYLPMILFSALQHKRTIAISFHRCVAIIRTPEAFEFLMSCLINAVIHDKHHDAIRVFFGCNTIQGQLTLINAIQPHAVPLLLDNRSRGLLLIHDD